MHVMSPSCRHLRIVLGATRSIDATSLAVYRRVLVLTGAGSMDMVCLHGSGARTTWLPRKSTLLFPDAVRHGRRAGEDPDDQHDDRTREKNATRIPRNETGCRR